MPGEAPAEALSCSGGTTAAATPPMAVDCPPPSPYSILYFDAPAECDRRRSSSSLCSLKDELSIEEGLDGTTEEASLCSPAAAAAAAGTPAAGSCQQRWERFQLAM